MSIFDRALLLVFIVTSLEGMEQGVLMGAIASQHRAMKTDHQAESQEDVCPICRNEKNNPQALACGHSYCKDCLIDLVAHAQSNNIVCSVCRQISPVNIDPAALLTARQQIQQQAQAAPHIPSPDFISPLLLRKIQISLSVLGLGWILADRFSLIDYSLVKNEMNFFPWGARREATSESDEYTLVEQLRLFIDEKNYEDIEQPMIREGLQKLFALITQDEREELINHIDQLKASLDTPFVTFIDRINKPLQLSLLFIVPYLMYLISDQKSIEITTYNPRVAQGDVNFAASGSRAQLNELRSDYERALGTEQADQRLAAYMSARRRWITQVIIAGGMLIGLPLVNQQVKDRKAKKQFLAALKEYLQNSDLETDGHK